MNSNVCLVLSILVAAVQKPDGYLDLGRGVIERVNNKETTLLPEENSQETGAEGHIIGKV